MTTHQLFITSMSDALLCHPGALVELEVATTNSRAQSVPYNIFRKWLKMLLMERHVALIQKNDVLWVIYLDYDGLLNIVGIIITPLVRLDRAEWVIGQQGNKLTESTEGIKLDALEICGLVLVLIQEALANHLGLKRVSTLILTAENYTL